MTSQITSLPETERHLLDRLRERYEAEGYSFVAGPPRAALPDFLHDHVPDALACKPGRNVAIAIKRQSGRSTERDLATIRQRLEGHPGWHLHVAYAGADPSDAVTIPVASQSVIRSRTGDVRALLAQGHRRPAFVTAWSLLEAALGVREERMGYRPSTPGTVVQSLAMNGYIEPATERALYALIDLRNRVVHGDLTAEPSAGDVERVLATVEEVLTVEPV
ncbi:hypothetical protein [uncultured Methylobacterium sp.]|jgi:hypothetical protein|uniref:hypothetical protein n=1 Tax=uncultured Methylobacterium sp. TaxID=157278 RepID=UPI00260884FF|nr:hypothetical protein [uncultured Methylobacterium sp.]